MNCSNSLHEGLEGFFYKLYNLFIGKTFNLLFMMHALGCMGTVHNRV